MQVQSEPLEHLFPQVLAGAVASTYKDGCTYLRGRLQVLASEMGKRHTEITSPILDNYCPLNFLERMNKLRADSICWCQPKTVIGMSPCKPAINMSKDRYFLSLITSFL